MNTATTLRNCAAALALLVATGLYAGEQRSGDFMIRYNALTTQALPAAAASSYDLPRSTTQGLLIVAVTQRNGDSVPATATGRASTLLGQSVPLRFRSVLENGNASTLGTFTVPASGSLRFDLDVTPHGGATTHLHFVQDFVVD